jgi:(E)-4-hydroxy-3-methylbut-2-enyl-diphosphate synthase
MPTDNACDLLLITPALPAARRSRQARVVWGDRVVTVGGDAPVTRWM